MTNPDWEEIEDRVKINPNDWPWIRASILSLLASERAELVGRVEKMFKPIPPVPLDDLSWMMRKSVNMDERELEILRSKEDNHKRDMIIVAAQNDILRQVLALLVPDSNSNV